MNNKIMTVKNYPYIALKLIGIFGIKKKKENLRSSWIVSILPFCLETHTLFCWEKFYITVNKF